MRDPMWGSLAFAQKKSKYDSICYDAEENRVWLHEQQNITQRQLSFHRFWHWFVVFWIAICTALSGIAIQQSQKYLFWFKFHTFQQFINNHVNWACIFAAYIGMNLMLVSVAAYLTAYVEPVIKGKTGEGGMNHPRVWSRNIGGTSKRRITN